MERWGEVNHSLVKAVAGFSVPLFLALNFPTAFLVILAGILFYAIALLGVMLGCAHFTGHSRKSTSP